MLMRERLGERERVCVFVCGWVCLILGVGLQRLLSLMLPLESHPTRQRGIPGWLINEEREGTEFVIHLATCGSPAVR